MAVTPTLLFFGMAMTGLIHGRLKVEPNSPWIVFRDHPAKFVAVVVSYLVLGSLCGTASPRVGSAMLG